MKPKLVHPIGPGLAFVKHSDKPYRLVLRNKRNGVPWAFLYQGRRLVWGCNPMFASVAFREVGSRTLKITVPDSAGSKAVPITSAKPPMWFVSIVREAVANYMQSEGCSCCRDERAHDFNRARLAKLLGIRKRAGFHDFSKYRTQKAKDNE